MSSPSKDTEEPTSTNEVVSNGAGAGGSGSSETKAAAEDPRPPAKRRMSSTVIEISDTESDDSDICAVTSYQASADEVKRIRGDYSSSSSSSDYSSDSESPWEDDSTVVSSPPPASAAPFPVKEARAKLNPRAPRTADPKFREALQSQELIDRLTEHWKEQKDLSNNDLTLTCEPFRLCLLHNLLSDPDIINNIVDDMNTLDWSRKKMDLYEFHQTTDLASLTWQRGIKGIYELLKTEVMAWVSKVTGLELTSISASCSLYGPGDHLLVHDDLLSDRRVAFILYLAPWRPRNVSYQRDRMSVPAVENGDGDHVDVDQVEQESYGWAEHMGGALELLACDEKGRPTHVSHRVYPRNNMLAFFKVGKDSFHQVSEILSLELPRLSINGWFHGPAPAGLDADATAEANDEETPTDKIEAHKPHNHVVLIQQWVSGAYMSPRVRAQVQQQMERDSELCLRAFLPQNTRTELLDALQQQDLPWEPVGPANQRRYSVLPLPWVESLEDEHVLKRLVRVLTSTAFFRLLVDCTDLALTAYQRLELQRWRAGDFTLLPPREQYQESRLEAVLYLGVPPHPICGGSTTYVAPEDPTGPTTPNAPTESSLVTLPPTDNALNLVYCDSGAAAFTKYISKITLRPDQHFFIITCTYKE